MIARKPLVLGLLLTLASALAYSPAALATPTRYTNQCAGCHGATPTTCNGCHQHGGSPVGSIPKNTFAPGESMTVSVTAGTRTGWWRAAVLDASNRPLQTLSVASGLTATLTLPAPSSAGTYAWKVAWYGNEYPGTGSGWVADAGNPTHGYQTASLPSFTVTAPASAQLALSPSALAFGGVNVGASSSLSTQLRNTGTATLTISAIGRCASPATSAAFTWSPTALPISVNPGASATLTVAYAPTAAGAEAGCIALTSNSATAAVTNLSVSGTGVVPAAPHLSLSATALSFGNVTVGATASQRLTVSNTGTATLTGTVARASGTSAEYAAAPATFSVAPGASQDVTVTYAPTAAGADAGNLALTSNDPAGATATVALSGAGVAAPAPIIALEPTALAFGTVTVGGSVSRTALIRNTGNAPLAVTQLVRCASPATSTEFTWSPAAPFTVAAGGSATVSVAYAPTAAGADAGCLAVSSNDTAHPVVSLDVAGTGAAVAAPRIVVTPAALDFGSLVAGSSAQRTLTISNPGTATLTGTVARASGTSAEYSAVPAAFNLAPGASQAVVVTYAPTAAGSDAGALTLASNDPVTPSLAVTVSGTGTAVPVPAIALAPTSLTFGTVTVGGTATLSAQLRSTGTAPLHVTGIAPCAGTSAAFGFTPAAPLTVAPGANVALQVTYRPTAAGSDSGCLAVTSDDPASPTVQLGLSGTAVAQAVPAIALDPASLDFGTVLVGSTASRIAQVRNTGTGALTVRRVAACAGTPSTFGASPAGPFTVAPGASVALTATYRPGAAGAEAGCFAVESDDVAHPSVNLAVAAIGAQPPVPSTDADVDVTRLQIPIFLTPGQPATARLSVVNRSAVAGAPVATLTSTLWGREVYRNRLVIEVAAGQAKTVAFPALVAPAGFLRWTLVLEDGDPDLDRATAVTLVRRWTDRKETDDDDDDEVEREDDLVERSSIEAAQRLGAEGDATSSAGGCATGGGVGLAGLMALAGLALGRRRTRRGSQR